ncbi:putative enterotoxin [Cordyceps sp. RAO-2017]|nr:putative enterotoxin [Cordyceps sp. RAO-2017]
MYLTNLILAVPLCLSWSCSAHANISTKGVTLFRRQFGSFVYRGDRRWPEEIARAGGFRPQGAGWQDDESAFHFDRHYSAGPSGCGLEEYGDPDFDFRTAYVSVAQRRSVAEAYGDWLYEIRATPNMLDDNYPESEAFSLGGVHWRQVRRFTRMVGHPSGNGNRVVETRWTNNPDYDIERYERGPYAGYSWVSESFPEVLRNGDPDSSDSDSGDESGPSRARPRRAIVAAERFMAETRGIFELFGTFPPEFEQYSAREGIPRDTSPSAAVGVNVQGKGLLWRRRARGIDPEHRGYANNG